MFTGAAVISGGGGGKSGMLEGLIIEKLNGWDIEKRYALWLSLLDSTMDSACKVLSLVLACVQ